MVISCPECATKFRVNPEKIPDSGTKVRCARCKHVFFAEKPAPEVAAPVIPEPVSPPEETQITAEPSVAPAEEVSEEQSFEEPALAEEPSFDEPEEEAPAADDGSFSYEKFREMDSDQDDEDFQFGEEEDEAPFSTSDEIDSEEEEESFSFAGPEEDELEAQEEAPQEEAGPQEEISDDKIQISTGEVISKEEAFARIFSDDEEAPAAEENIEEQEDMDVDVDVPEGDEEQEDDSAVSSVETKERSSSSPARVLLLLILGLAIIGGALFFINGPEQFEEAIQQIFGQVDQAEQAGNIALTNLEGKFIKNQEAGELFVIRGEAVNNFKEPRAAIQVKGVIFDQNGKPLLQKTIFCGNPINDQELQTLPFSTLEERMRNQFGKSLKNMKVNSKQTIPFVIAFRDLPKNLSEFSVDIASSEPAAQ